MSFGSFSLRELTCMHCVSDAVNTQGFVWKFFFLCAIYKFSFIHSFIKTAIDTTISSHVPVRNTLGGVAAMTQSAHLTGCCCGIMITAHVVMLWTTSHTADIPNERTLVFQQFCLYRGECARARARVCVCVCVCVWNVLCALQTYRRHFHDFSICCWQRLMT